MKPVDRLATPRDLMIRQQWELRELDVIELTRKRVAELHLKNIKIVATEYSFDGSRLAIIYSCEGEEKVDLKSLWQDTQSFILRRITPDWPTRWQRLSADWAL